MNRRNFLRLGIGAAIAAPALVSRANIMAIKVPRPPNETITGLQMLLEEQIRLQSLLFPDSERWMIIHPDRARDLQWIGVDHGRPEGDESAIVRGVYNSRGQLVIGEIDRFSVYISPNLPPAPPVSPTAIEIRAKRAEAWQQMRRWLEPKGSRRWV